MATKIEWTDETWNPITGCSPISEGCANCYAKRMAARLRGRFGYPADGPFKVTFHPDRLGQPLKWKKPRRVFVCSMGDIFHANVELKWLERIWDMMFDAPQHTFILLTKRPFNTIQFIDYMEDRHRQVWYPNIWLGVPAENQQRANERIPALLKIPAAVRFVSVEPMLGPVSLDRMQIGECYLNSLSGDFSDSCADPGEMPSIDWVICGGETAPGHNYRSMRTEWARGLRYQCKKASVPFFFKRWSGWGGKRRHLLDGSQHHEWPK